MSDHLPALTGKRLIQALGKAGWEISHIRGSHHQLVHRETGRRITVPVHAGKDIKRGLLRALLRDIGITIEEFHAML